MEKRERLTQLRIKNYDLQIMKNYNKTLLLCAFSVIIFFSSCNNQPKKIDKQPEVANQPPANKQLSPNFNADSAYYFVQKQCDFGPRVTNSIEAKKCGDWMVSELKKYTDNVIEQRATITNFDDRKLNIRNIIAEINPKAKKRIMLCSHWDSRPYADKDNLDPDKPILGANDGASGVGVLMEITRILKSNPVDIGIDIILFDAEDLGKNTHRNSYCLGSQYWSTNLHHPNYKVDFGILLDMVGASNAKFAWEENSVEYAKPYLDKVWNIAQNLGYSKNFVYVQYGGIEDDHYYVIKNAHIPTIDIIHLENTPNTFPEHHHTHRDNMSVIDRETLKAVGQTLLEVIYSEK
jgi:glutaminyl-peptide cyclotransferase